MRAVLRWPDGRTMQCDVDPTATSVTLWDDSGEQHSFVAISETDEDGHDIYVTEEEAARLQR